MLWVGIDEAGYGPNLGPLVMSAVIAEGPDDSPPDVWADLPDTVSRAGGPPDRLWVDDSKQVYKARKGRERLDQACFAVIEAVGRGIPSTFGALLKALNAGSLASAELAPWIDADPCVDPIDPNPCDPFVSAKWRLIDVKSVVVGPAQFNNELDAANSKAHVHFRAFAELLTHIWTLTTDTRASSVRGDKHGGRHFYLDKLVEAFPDLWIDRGEEGPDLSAYTLRSGDRRLDLRLEPRADAGDGLVALASLVSKAVRERWMNIFNAYWTARIPDLRPTAGYPEDAKRYRTAIEPACQARGMSLDAWWRRK